MPPTLEMTFKEPAAYNANIAGMWTAYAQPKWLIEGDDCTEAQRPALDRAWLPPDLWPVHRQRMGPRLQHHPRQEPLLARH